MLSLLVLAAAPVAFNGGSPSELAKSIAEATQSNVVIEAGWISKEEACQGG